MPYLGALLHIPSAAANYGTRLPPSALWFATYLMKINTNASNPAMQSVVQNSTVVSRSACVGKKGAYA